jgi:hypothetical protein
MSDCKDPDALYDDETIFVIDIAVLGDGCLRTSGDIHDKQYALACIDAAKETVKRHCAKPSLVPYVPPKITKPDDVLHAIQIKVRRNGNMSTGGSINDLALALQILDHGREAVMTHHRKLHGGQVIVPSKDTEFVGHA